MPPRKLSPSIYLANATRLSDLQARAPSVDPPPLLFFSSLFSLALSSVFTADIVVFWRDARGFSSSPPPLSNHPEPPGQIWSSDPSRIGEKKSDSTHYVHTCVACVCVYPRLLLLHVHRLLLRFIIIIIIFFFRSYAHVYARVLSPHCLPDRPSSAFLSPRTRARTRHPLDALCPPYLPPLFTRPTSHPTNRGGNATKNRYEIV